MSIKLISDLVFQTKTLLCIVILIRDWAQSVCSLFKRVKTDNYDQSVTIIRLSPALQNVATAAAVPNSDNSAANITYFINNSLQFNSYSRLFANTKKPITGKH
jgi:hypothetical protein